jgi:hypothetical protein
MMVHWPSYLYIYPSWTDILAYYTDRITDVTDAMFASGIGGCPSGSKPRHLKLPVVDVRSIVISITLFGISVPI